MKKNISRFAAVLSLTVVLGSTPAIAAPSRDGGGAPERTPIVRLIQKLVQRLFGVKPTAEPIIPIPGPSSTSPNP